MGREIHKETRSYSVGTRRLIMHRAPHRKFQQKVAAVRNLKWWEWLSSWHGTVFQAAWRSCLFPFISAWIVTLVQKSGLYNFDWDMTGWSVVMIPLAFLLVFRTQVSFERYWTGRGFISAVVANCRSLVRKSVIYTGMTKGRRRYSVSGKFAESGDFSGEEEPPGITEEETGANQAIDNLRHLLVGFMFSVRWDVQRMLMNNVPTDEAELFLSEDQRDFLHVYTRYPLAVLYWCTQNVDVIAKEFDLEPYEKEDMQGHIDNLQAAWQDMTRVTFTPIPFPFTHLCKALVFTWCGSVPVGLVQQVGWFTPMATIFLAFGLVGLVQAGISVEYPFGLDYNNFLLEDFEIAVDEDADTMTSGLPGWRIDEEDFLSGAKGCRTGPPCGPSERGPADSEPWVPEEGGGEEGAATAPGVRKAPVVEMTPMESAGYSS